jgi:putative colanic acid biosysnthesis UDP-glucose lipid carrier transferase
VKPLQNLGIIAHNTTIQKRTVKGGPGSYRNGISSKPVARQKNYLLLKRSFDILFSVLIILLVLSWLLPIIGFLIKLDSKGPVFFKQKRIGLNGKPFVCLKLRTMIVNKEADESPAIKNDYRITPLGVYLRQTNLDELAQFFNVLAGQMSLVGPRPHMVADCIRFSFVIPSYPLRHFVKPGITGWAQIKGYHGPTPDYESILNRYYWDAQYVRRAGFWLDIKIIVLTIAGNIYQLCAKYFPFFKKLANYNKRQANHIH